jgi:NAD(P)-dependent dehydrogenase (short-subunit alcohol dehydrogenase family)
VGLLDGRVAVITGSGRGIGREFALSMASEGAKVVVNDVGVSLDGRGTDEDPAASVCKEIEALGGEAVPSYDSVTEFDAAERIIGTAVEAFGTIDILVNNAGIVRDRTLVKMSEEDFDAVIAVHLKGTWNMAHHAIKLMRGERFGRIVNFSSDAFKGSVGQCNYAAAKAGVIGLTRTIARECGRYGITANAMCPFAATRMTVNDAVIANWKRRVESGLLTQAEFEARMAMPGPEFVAPMVAYLCTDAAKDVNGQIFHAEKSHYHTYTYGDVARSIYKYENNGEFTVDELIKLIPASLMAGIPNVAPAEET